MLPELRTLQFQNGNVCVCVLGVNGWEGMTRSNGENSEKKCSQNFILQGTSNITLEEKQ